MVCPAKLRTAVVTHLANTGIREYAVARIVGPRQTPYGKLSHPDAQDNDQAQSIAANSPDSENFQYQKFALRSDEFTLDCVMS